jgi:kinesin family protein 15
LRIAPPQIQLTAMEMLRRNLKRQASRSLSAFAAADDQENLHPNLAAASPPNKSSLSPSPRSKPAPPTASAPVPPPPEAADQNRAAPARAPADHEPPVKVPSAGSRQTPFLSNNLVIRVSSKLRASLDDDCRRGFAQVVVRVRPAVSLPVDGKDLFFVRKTSPTSVAVGDRAFAVDGFLDDRASQVVNHVSLDSQSSLFLDLCRNRPSVFLKEFMVIGRRMRSIWWVCP